MLLSAIVIATTKGLRLRWLLGHLAEDVFGIGRATARRVKVEKLRGKDCMFLDLRKGEPCIFDGTCGHGEENKGEAFSAERLHSMPSKMHGSPFRRYKSMHLFCR